MKSVKPSFHDILFPNIHDEGLKFISILAIISLILLLISTTLGVIFLLITLICFYSFKDNKRVTPILSGVVISPSDGIVISITKEKGPDVFDLRNKNFNKIRIFSTFFNNHIKRIPIKGKIINTFYDDEFDISCIGGFNIFKSLGFNYKIFKDETFLIHIKDEDGNNFIIQFYSPCLCKKIKLNVKRGNEFLAGNKVGFIRFCSYVDIFLPEKISPQVCIGQTMISGETIVADTKSDAPRINGEIR
jgi:phosphatidylserine decarboxylase